MYLSDIGFSLWADFVERSFLEGEFCELVDGGIVNGATSNPAIFKEAILRSKAYREELAATRGLDPKSRYERIATADIRRACEILLPLFEAGDDGFASIEVDPRLAFDSEATVKEARRLLEAIDMPNAMIKIPATDAGYEAMRELAKEGVHLNATLVFSAEQAKRCLDAFSYAKGAKSVISIFVSRFDRRLDPKLPQPLRGKTGIMNAAAIYNLIQRSGLEDTKALFASTGVKGGEYPPAYYIKELLAPRSVNTAPIHTIEAFVKEKSPKPKLPLPQEEIDKFFARLSDNGVDMEEISSQLLQEGLQAFVEAFGEILKELG